MSAVGDNCVDRYMGEGIAYPGGSCANVAVFARRLGLESGYIGVIGSDEAGDIIQRALQEEDVDISHAIFADEPSSTTDIRMENGNRVFTGHVPSRTPIELTSQRAKYLQGSAWIHSGHSSGTEQILPALASIAPVVFDFSHRGLEYAEGLLPHVSVAAFSRENAADGECEALLRQAAALGPRTALVTRGPRGAVSLVDGSLYVEEAEPIEVFDTMGAGDAFQTAFMVGITAEKQIADVMREATRFAAQVCTYRGAFGHQTAMTRRAG